MVAYGFNFKCIECVNSYLADSVENLMADTHELGGSTVVVDRATPKARFLQLII